jgi:PKD repeat protein
MKKFILLIFIPCSIFSYSQNRPDLLRNYQWIMGYGSLSTGIVKHTRFNFKGDSLSISYQTVANSLIMSYTNSSISDTSGNLLFFSNGCGIMDSTFHSVIGAEHINNGIYQDYLCNDVGGGRRVNSLIILPNYKGREFDVFYLRATNNSSAGSSLRTDKIFWTKIKLDSLNNLSTVFIDSTVVDSFFFGSSMSSCRHANGKDWWLITPGSESNKYYTLMISENEIHVQRQNIGFPVDYFEEATGESVFSPDGLKYARYSIHADLQVFDFDRCTGLLSNPIHVPIVDAADTAWAAGIAFSPSGRFLYVSSTRYIYQFDMFASDFIASKTTVAVYDGFMTSPGFATLFYQCELAPDGKIYVSCSGGRRAIHVIEYPDLEGIACQVVQHKYILEKPIDGGLPHFPNFRLGPLSDTCVVIPVGFAPIAGFHWSVLDSIQPLKVGFVDSSGFAPTAWHWDFGDGVVSQDSSPVHTYTQSGVYQVCLIVSNAFGVDTLCQWVSVMVSGVQDAEGLRFFVYPNPASNSINIVSSQLGKKYLICNSLGKIVLTGFLKQNTETISINTLIDGLYFLQVESVSTPVKFVVQQ